MDSPQTNPSIPQLVPVFEKAQNQWRKQLLASTCLYTQSAYYTDVGILQEKEPIGSNPPCFFEDNSGVSHGEGTTLNNRKPILGEQLAFLSVKYSVYLSELFDAIVLARKTGKATCQELKIAYRGSVANEAIILITQQDKVVMQFRASEELLLKTDISFEGWMNTDKIRKQIANHGTASGENNRIQDLRPGMKKINVEAEIIEIAKPLPLRTQYGNNVVLTNAWVADQTGKIRLCLWNEQADSVKLGDSVQMKNVSVSSFRGERQLRLGKKGTLSIMQNAIPNVNRELDQTTTARNMLFA